MSIKSFTFTPPAAAQTPGDLMTFEAVCGLIEEAIVAANAIGPIPVTFPAPVAEQVRWDVDAAFRLTPLVEGRWEAVWSESRDSLVLSKVDFLQRGSGIGPTLSRP